MASDYAHGPSDARKATTTLHRAPELGVTCWDTAAGYGFGANEELLRPMRRAHRPEVFLARLLPIPSTCAEVTVCPGPTAIGGPTGCRVDDTGAL